MALRFLNSIKIKSYNSLRTTVLDPALLRPGRFDRQVVVPLPDIRGREQILRVHLQKVPADLNVEPRDIARGTPGFSGADLSNLVNEAALFAARSNKNKVGKVTTAQIKQIAELKIKDMNCHTVESAMSQVRGTARSMGLEVVG